MKSVSARASYNSKIINRLFSTPERAHKTAGEVLAARSSTGKFVIGGMTFSTKKVKARNNPQKGFVLGKPSKAR